MKYDQIYVINLETDALRRMKMEDLIMTYSLGKLGHVKYFQAIDKRNMSPPKYFKGPSGAYGCTLSHIAVLQDALLNKYENILIFEDDLIIHKHFWDYDWYNIPKDAKIIYLGATQTSWSLIQIEGNFYRAKNTFGTTAYAVHGSTTMDHILSMWNQSPTLPIDELLAKFQVNHPCYVCFPNLFIQTVEESHIRSDDKRWDMKNISKRLRWDLSLYDFNYPYTGT